MMKNYFCALLMLAICAFGLQAQVTSSPSPLQEDAENVVIFFHADQGNKQMMGLPATTGVYAHTGACLSNGQTWVNAPDWFSNNDKYKMTFVEDNVWKLEIGDIRTFYGITDPAVNITKLAFVFRTADRSKEGKAEGNNDIFLDLVDSGLQLAITSSVSGSIITPSTGEVTFKVGATKAANLALFINGTEIAAAIGQKELTANYTFTTPGEYTVKATADANGEKAQKEVTYYYASDSAKKDYPGGNPVMGPVKLSDGTVRFCLAAPGKNSVTIIGAWNDYQMTNEQVMNYCDVDGFRYFWIDVKGLENDKMYGYYFLVDGQIKVGDPYARLVLDPYNDKYLLTDVFPNLPAYPEDKIMGVPLAIYQGNINDYDWQVKSFKGADPSNLIIYELLFRDFTGTEGKADGNGTVRKAMEKLPYLKTLGVNAIEVMPICEFSGNNSWGYNPNFYFAPDKAYGTPDDYKEFIDLCHQNGIAVILDVVFNQADGLHPWYQMYMPEENPFFNLNAPHAYSVFNDWNQGYPLVFKQWADVLTYWLKEYKFDGFRFDLVKGLGLNDSYANNGDAATNAYNASRVAQMRKLQEVVESVNPNAYFINENLATAKEENEMAATGELNWANVNTQGCQYAMGYQDNSGLERFYAPKDDRTWGSTVSYLESHDEERLAYKQNQYGASGVKGNLTNSMNRIGSAAAQMILAPGAHMIWQFSELGNYDSTKNASGGNNTDPKVVRWSLFDNPTRHGLYDCYSELIDIRNCNPDLFAESATFSSQVQVNNWSTGRTLVSKAGSKELYTVINPNINGKIAVTVNFEQDDSEAYQILSKSYESEPTFDAAAKTVTVPANCYVVIGSKDVVSAVESISIDPAEPSIRAYAADGEIIVDYVQGKAFIYGVDGHLAGVIRESGSLSVAPGVYFIKTAGATMKIAVR